MSEEYSRQTKKEFKYTSPSRKTIDTPIKSAFKSSRYNVGVFLEKMNELNKMNEKIKGINIKSCRENESENESTDEPKNKL